MPQPTAIADVDPILQKQLTSLSTQAAAEQTARLQGSQAVWMIPELNGWSGSVFDLQGMAMPFDRSQSNAWFTQATKTPGSPGTSGDLVITTTQIDYLAVMERSFRARYMTRTRAMCHAMGRKSGHGNARGPLMQSVMDYINGLVSGSKS